MAKDLILLGGILSLWFCAITLFGLVASDPTLQSLSTGSYTGISGENTTFEISGDTDVNLLTFQNTGFWGVITSLFSFSLPNVIGMPVLIGTFISFANYGIVAFAGLIAFRLIRNGGG